MNFRGFSDEIEIRAVSKPNKNVEELFRAYNIKMEEERASDNEELDITVPIIEMQCEDSDEQNNSSNNADAKSEENNKFNETANSIINGDEEGTLVSIQVGTPKLQRTVLSLEEKVKVLEEREKGFSERKLAELFKCSKTQISNVLKNKNSIINDWIENKHSGTRRKRSEKYEEINYEVLEWVKKARAQNMQMSVKLLKEKAVEISRRRGIADFSASNGWLERFRIRNNLNFKSVAGQMTSPDSVAWKERLPSLLMSYDVKNIYNLDETGIFFRTLPTKGCTLSGEDCKRGDLASERVTVALCTNAVGDKEPPLIIAKPQSPLERTNLGFSYHTHPKSWMNSVIFGKWLRAFDQKMVQQNRNVLLLLDNAPCHYTNIHLKKVKLQYLPPLSSCSQPLDRGILKNFKLLYQKHLVRHVAVRASGSARAEEVARRISLTDCLFWVKSAWKEIEPMIITDCFALCGITTSACREKVESGIEKSLEKLAMVAGIELDLKKLNEPSCFDTMTETEEPPRLSGRKAEEGKEKTKEKKKEEEEVSVGAIDILQNLYECRHGILKSSSFNNKEELSEKLFALEQQVESEIANRKMLICVPEISK